MSSLQPERDWDTASDQYFKIVGEKTPSQGFTNNHKGIAKLLELLKKIDAPGNKDVEKDLLKFLVDFRAAKANYLKVLQALIDKEKDTVVFEKKGPLLQKPDGSDKTQKTNKYRGLKMLKSKLESYESAVEQSILIRQTADNQTDKWVARYASGFNTALKRWQNSKDTIKATPTAEVWNQELKNDAIRSLTTALTPKYILKDFTAQNQGQLTEAQRGLVDEANRWVKVLTPWADGAKRQLPPDADVPKELAEVSAHVKRCQEAMRPHIA